MARGQVVAMATEGWSGGAVMACSQGWHSALMVGVEEQVLIYHLWSYLYSG